MTRQWPPIADAIRLVAERRKCSEPEAWAAIRIDICDGELPVRGIADRGQPIPVEPHWLDYLLNAFIDMPVEASLYGVRVTSDAGLLDGYFWFDRRKAAEDLLATVIARRGSSAPSLPPDYVRSLRVNAARLNELYPAADAAASDLPPLKATIPAEPRKRGPRPQKLNATIARMRAEIGSKCFSRSELSEMHEKNLADRYGVSRDTARKARNFALAQERVGICRN
jgi:hypothetical protein